jgi:hypothetical protein
MSTLYVAEFASLNNDATAGSGFLAGKMPPLAEQALAIGGTSTPSAPFSQGTRLIRISSDAICSITVGKSDGTTPLATTGNLRMAANAPPEYFAVTPGARLAVIANT